eukprot:7384635-Prymnesium_polylepis.2
MSLAFRTCPRTNRLGTDQDRHRARTYQHGFPCSNGSTAVHKVVIGRGRPSTFARNARDRGELEAILRPRGYADGVVEDRSSWPRGGHLFEACMWCDCLCVVPNAEAQEGVSVLSLQAVVKLAGDRLREAKNKCQGTPRHGGPSQRVKTLPRRNLIDWRSPSDDRSVVS